MAIQNLEKTSKELKKQITWATIEEQENVNISFLLLLCDYCYLFIY